MEIVSKWLETLSNSLLQTSPVEDVLDGEDIKEHENLFKQILDTSSVAICFIDLHGNIAHANHRMAEMFHFPLNTLIHEKKYLDLVHPNAKMESSEKLFALLNDKLSSLELERLYIRSDHSVFWGHFTGKVFYNTHGIRLGAVAVIADIDERKYIQQCEQHHKHILHMMMHKEPLARILHTMVEEIHTMHLQRLSCTVFLLDETKQKLYIGATSLSLAQESITLLQTIYNDSHLFNSLLALPQEPHLMSTFATQHPAWHTLFQNTHFNASYLYWIVPIYSPLQTSIGFMLLCSNEQRPLSSQELKLIEDDSAYIALAVDKSRNDAKLQLAANVFTHSKEGIIITQPDGEIIEANEAFCRSCGYSMQEIIGQNPRILKSGRQHASFYKHMWESIFTKGSWQGEIWNRHKNGNIYAEMVTISAIKNSQGEVQHFVALFTDISAIKEHEQELEHLAQHDALTALPNRLLLKDRLSQAIAEAKRYHTYLAVVYVDLDGFKAVNDTYGHTTGDELLVIVAQKMSSIIRQNETIARLGGDELLSY